MAGGGAAGVSRWQPGSLFPLAAANLLEGLPRELLSSEKRAGKQSHAQTSSEHSCGAVEAARRSMAVHKFSIQTLSSGFQLSLSITLLSVFPIIQMPARATSGVH